MQFQVPQFIDVEDKIFGPLTFKQFIYLLGGAALIFIVWIFLPKWLAILLAIPVGAFALALAFLKISGLSFIAVISNALHYSSRARLYTWKQVEKKVTKTAETKKKAVDFSVPKLSENRLKELSWSLDIHKKLQR